MVNSSGRHNILNIYALNRPSKYTKKILTELKGKIDKSMIVVGEFNTFSIIDMTII